MKPRLLAIFLVLVFAPLAVLAWLGIKMAQDEQHLVAHRVDQLLVGRLAEVQASVDRMMEQRQSELIRILSVETTDKDHLRTVARSEPFVRQVFVLDREGKLLHPPPVGPRNASEEAFLTRTRSIWEAKEPFFRPPEGAKGRASDIPTHHGWHVWYWDRGINLIYWRIDDQGQIVGAEVERMALLAELIAGLPSTNPDDPDLPKGSIRLVDADGDVLYAWGPYDPAEGEGARASRALDPPLGSWKLEYFPAPGELDAAFGGNVLLGMGTGFGALVLAIAGLALYFFRESGRDVRDAQQRITFVNQVSHELKTPLTNIRMYAELMEEQLGDDDEGLGEYVSVIVAESQRLSRLIANVLSFARQQRGKLVLRRAPGNVSDTIRQVLDQFKPSFDQKGIQIDLDLACEETAEYDADALGQILGNLLSNVEKYAGSGEGVEVRSHCADHRLVIDVADSGPGVPEDARERIFEPFVRLSGKLTDGVAGTGIGLSIARDLARLHGGDLTLEPSKRGARFRITLDVGQPTTVRDDVPDEPSEKGDSGEGADRGG